jgi:hypothetical protein
MFASCCDSWYYYSFLPHYAQESLYEVQNIYTQVSDVSNMLFTVHVSGEYPSSGVTMNRTHVTAKTFHIIFV